MAERIGQQLGNYRLIQLLGRGGFADVYLGEHMHLGTQAAIKVLHTRLVSESIERFRREARTIARLEHPHIVRVLDFGVEGGTPFLAMSYAPNGTLRQRHLRGTQVPLKSVVSYVKQVASALQYAHEHHVIHRDIKPENLLVGRNDEILLSDFGIALVTQSAQSQHTQDLAGTIAYMAPEQIKSHPRLSSDQYSLAVLTYEWLSGDRLFQGSFTEIAIKHIQVPPPPLREKVPMLSPAVEQVVLTALAKDPKQRFATIQAFATALEDAAHLFQTGQISEQDSFSASPLVGSTVPSELVAPPKPPTASAELMTPPNQPIPITEVVSLSSPSALSMPTASAEQALLTELPAEPSPRGLSRRSVLIGLAGLVGVGAAGTGIAWLLRSPSPQISFPSPSPKPSPSLSPTSSSTLARSITSSGAMFGFDPQHTHFNPVEQTLSVANVSHLAPYWKALTGATITSSPAVVNGVVYVGCDDHYLYAFDTATGTQVWKARTGNQVHSSPAVAKGVVYVGSEDSKLYVFDAATGHQRWSVLIGNFVDSSPAVVNGIVYVGCDDYYLYAFDTAGTQQWSTLTDYPVYCAPAVANGIVYTSSPNARLYAFDATTGTRLWSFPTGDLIASSPAVVNGVIYVGSNDHYLYAIDTTGKQRWKASTAGSITSSPAVANGVVYIGSGDGKLYAFNASTGTQLWSAPIGIQIPNSRQITSSPMVANGVVYIGSGDGNLYAFHLS